VRLDSEPTFLSAPHTFLHTIVQAATVELFHSRGIALAPLPAGQLVSGQAGAPGLAGLVTFNAPQLSGSLALFLADGIYGLFTPAVVGVATTDVLRELTNQLAGRMKNRLLQFQVTLQVGMPSIVSNPAFDRTARNEVATRYAFRTLRGEVRVVLAAAVQEGVLTYSNAVKVAKEGEFTPF
jgi:hypothetical protein